jgi:biopolymer transport protein ExbD
MAIKIPGKRVGKRLEHSKVFGSHALHGKRSVNADLNITAMVDMFTIIVLFLIANFSATGDILNMTKDIVLPEASNTQEIQLVPVVMVSAEQVTIDGTIVGRTEDLSREEYLNIAPLEEKLRDMKKKYEDLRSFGNDDPEQAFKGDVNIQADKAVQFRIIKRVMFSCASAGYNNINFAVLGLGDVTKGEGAPAAAPAAVGGQH